MSYQCGILETQQLFIGFKTKLGLDSDLNWAGGGRFCGSFPPFCILAPRDKTWQLFNWTSELFVLSFAFVSFFPEPPLFFSLFPFFPYFSYFFFVVCVCVSVCVCIFVCMYVRAYLAIPCVSANDNVKHIKSNIRYVFYKKINKMQ